MVGVEARHQIGIRQLVFETDYPHQDSTWPDTPALVAEIGERVTPEELEMLMRTNAIAMLDLDPADLRPEVAA
jgi:predicted TIM-barrel fold metal-dependent hydrolase